MTVVEVKSALHKLIDKTEDMNVLKSVLLILKKISEKKETDFWDVISEEEKASIEKGLSEAKKGELLSNEDVMREVKENNSQSPDKLESEAVVNLLTGKGENNVIM